MKDKGTIITIIITVIISILFIIVVSANIPKSEEPISTRDWATGNLTSTIILEEFSDFQCPYCNDREKDTVKPLLEIYKDKIKFVFRQYPLSGHKYAMSAAIAAEIAGHNGKFFEYSDKLFSNYKEDGSHLQSEKLIAYAKEIGLDETQFSSDLSNEKYKDDILNDMKIADFRKIGGTPAFYLNNKLINADLNSLKIAIDAALANINITSSTNQSVSFSSSLSSTNSN